MENEPCGVTIVYLTNFLVYSYLVYLSTLKSYSQKILEPMRTRVLPSAMAMG